MIHERPRVRLWSRLKRGPADSHAIEHDDDVDRVLDSVREHLGWLLNTRRGDAPACRTFGLPDLAGVVAALPSSERQFYAAVEKSISEHEPRISWVRVRLNDSNVPGEIRIQFTVEVLLKSEKDMDKRRLEAEVNIDTVFALT